MKRKSKSAKYKIRKVLKLTKSAFKRKTMEGIEK